MNSELEKIAYVYGDVCVRRKKQRRKRQKLLVLELLFDYAKNSTLHGLRYIVDQGLNIIERLFWFLMVIASILLCVFYIYNVVHKWRTGPVIVTVNERLASVGSVPFPSVTICPQIKVNPNFYNYTEKLKMYKDNKSLRYGEDFSKFQNIRTMCDRLGLQKIPVNTFTDSSIVKDIIEAAPSIQDIFISCEWHSRDSNCQSLFSKVITEEGVCYTFNSLAANAIFEDTVQQNYTYMDSTRPQAGWSIEEGYNYNYNKTMYPMRGHVFGSGPDLALMMVHDPDKGDKSCNTIFSGYKIYLHHPADFPQTSLYYYAALPRKQSSVAISFHELNSDKDLVAYNSQIRQCYFPVDRKLRYFKIYTLANCQSECLSRYTYLICKCVGFHMPHHNSSKICHPLNWKCMRRARATMAREERSGYLDVNRGICNCLPACNTVEYDAEILKTDFQIEDYMKQLKWYNPLSTYSRIELFYKKSQFVSMQRRELFGVTEMLANIGGLLGVFLGFSFLSFIEILYFLTVRLGFILKRDSKEEKLKEKSKMGEILVISK